MLFALPAMQRNQRDRQRTQDYSSLSSNITSYITNNSGNLPKDCTDSTTTAGTICQSPEKYINTKGVDQQGNPYKLNIKTCKTNENGNPCTTPIEELAAGYTEVKVYVVKQAKCVEDIQGKAEPVTSKRAFAVIGQLETGVFCLSSE